MSPAARSHPHWEEEQWESTSISWDMATVRLLLCNCSMNRYVLFVIVDLAITTPRSVPAGRSYPQKGHQVEVHYVGKRRSELPHVPFKSINMFRLNLTLMMCVFFNSPVGWGEGMCVCVCGWMGGCSFGLANASLAWHGRRKRRGHGGGGVFFKNPIHDH